MSFLKPPAKKQFKLGDFEGPLDLLLHLAGRHKVDLHQIPLALLTEQYLACLAAPEAVGLEEMSEFYVMASRLIYLKSRLLLPRDEATAQETEELKTEIIDELVGYAKYKTFMAALGAIEPEERWEMLRRPRIKPFVIEDERIEAPLAAAELTAVFAGLIKNISNAAVFSFFERHTVNKKIMLLYELSRKKSRIFFDELVTVTGDRYEQVCAFLAVLEAARRMAFMIEQEADRIVLLKRRDTGEFAFF
jgi:segregation and condensation protein A